MNKIDRNTIKKELLIPFIVTFAAALLMVCCVFLPYATATEHRAEIIDDYPDAVVFADIDLTAKDMKNVSMVKYAYIYTALSQQFWNDPAAGILYAVLVGLIGGFSLAAALFALGRKPIPTVIFAGLAWGVFALLNKDFTSRGVIPSDSYDWGLAHTVFPIAAVIVLIGAIWMLVKKILIKKQRNADALPDQDT